MDGLLEIGGVWLARAYAFYGFAVLLIASFFFVNVLLLAAVVWAAVSHARGRQPWPYVPAAARRWARLAVEIAFGLINPALYLAILVPSLPPLRPHPEWWFATLTTTAWILLVAFWALRIFGAALDPRSRLVRAGVRTLLGAALACLLMYVVKDALLAGTELPEGPTFWIALRVCPLYLIPAVLLWDYTRSTSASSGDLKHRRHGLFLLPDRAARGVAASLVFVGLATFVVAAHRSSDEVVQKLVSDHREPILAAASRYDVDPRLIASIVYVTHRDQLSPFRGTLERLAISAWTKGTWPELGANETLLNRPLDISVGLAQIKPRTAQTASLLAIGSRPTDLPAPAAVSYRDGEPIGDGWTLPAMAQIAASRPFPVPADRRVVARALLDVESNLATCALILALYQNQWEVTNRAWSLRGRPDILATLYQIGFARSKPHGAPRSNAFGHRVREVYQQPWLVALFDTTPPPPPKRGTEDHAS